MQVDCFYNWTKMDSFKIPNETIKQKYLNGIKVAAQVT